MGERSLRGSVKAVEKRRQHFLPRTTILLLLPEQIRILGGNEGSYGLDQRLHGIHAGSISARFYRYFKDLEILHGYYARQILLIKWR